MSPRSAFIGRADELALLQAARNRLAHSQGSIALIGGDAGIGKSRLIRAFFERSRAGRPKTAVYTECFARGQSTLAPLRHLVADLGDGSTLPASPNQRALFRALA